jgi:putative spermidine/putrescine transport system ATP-binding protein
VLLLDEPLGALDLKLRDEMRAELKALQREVGITFVCVTHDQGEALTTSDRVAVLDRGRLQQVGSPADVYERPATPFVASFVGTSNVLMGESARRIVGAAGTYSIRPEKIRLSEEGEESGLPDHASATGTVAEAVYLGDATRFVVDLDGGGRLIALRQNLETSSADVDASLGTRVRLQWHRGHCVPVPSTASDSPSPATPTHSTG